MARRRPVALFFLGAAMLAQETPPLFRATTRLVEFTVIALDKNGNPVTSLTKDDFAIEDKGKAREIAFFHFEGAPPDPAPTARSAQPLPPGTVSNRVEYAPGPPRNLTALVIDTANTAQAELPWVRTQVARYLRTLAPDTRLAIYHLGAQLRVVHDFTDDAAELRARIHKILALPPQTLTDMDAAARDAEAMLKMFDDPVLLALLTGQLEADMLINDAARVRAVERAMAAMDALGQHLSGIPGRKSLVWISGGVPIVSITGAMGYGAKGGMRNFEEQVTRTAQRLAQNGVALYAADARGVRTSTVYNASVSSSPVHGRRPFERQQQAEEISNDPLPAMYLMTGVTGGRVLTNTNDPAAGMKAAAADILGAYSLAFYSSGEADGKWHSLRATVRRPGVKLLHRQGYLAEQTAVKAQNWLDAEWQTAIRNPLGSSAIHIEATCTPAEGAEPGVYDISVQVEPSDLYFHKVADRDAADLDMVIASKTPEGAAGYHIEKGTLSFPPAQLDRGPANCRYDRRWKAGPNVIAVRIFVRDRYTARYGSVDIPLKSKSSFPKPVGEARK